MAPIPKKRLRTSDSTRPRRWRHRGFFEPIGEALEMRALLSTLSPTDDYARIAPSWFERLPEQFATNSPAFVGPLAVAVGNSGGADWQAALEVAQWVVRLTPDATRQTSSLSNADYLLDRDDINFDVLRGLGLPGQLLVSSSGDSEAVRATLAGNPNVAMYEANAYFYTQATPNDPDFPSLTGLDNVGQFGATDDADIDAREAWDVDTGSTNVVVGVIDSGIDYTHPDLYLNVWINQGEIPATLKSQLVDADTDGRITFYDLNNPANTSRVSDFNNNTYIDAGDLFADSRWTDGVDTDHNAFVDDLFGWNFRSAADETFAPNDPQDVLGHGTHVAGTIGAIGNNSRGVTGVNWRSSLMALKFLDTGNSGQTADAVAAINYATMMREQFGEPIKVLNASWGQSGSESQALRDAIAAAGQSDMLFVAAAGNGNILGQGINLDRDPFFPASSDLPNVISVAASGPSDELARFSNFGRTSVDLAAPGIGVLSTLPGGRYGTANGTSMAAPHVAGVAALIWSELPFATPDEIRQAILTTVDTSSAFNTLTSTNGRLNARQAIDSTVFAPRAGLVSVANPVVSVAGGVDNLITVKYHDRQGINASTIGAGDIIATRQWGAPDTISATYVPNSAVITNGGIDVTASYRIAAPGGSWDPLDYGGYSLSVVAGQVKNTNGLAVPTDSFGQFSVRVADPAVFYVNSFSDAVDATVGNGVCADLSGDCTLRAAVQEANAIAPALRTIILNEGVYQLSIAPVPETPITFPLPAQSSGCFLNDDPFVSSDVRSGDLDVLGNVVIYGNQTGSTTIDAAGIDRVLKVYSGGQLALNRATITGGNAPDGGGILNSGTLSLNLATIKSNSATRSGGGLALFSGTTTITASTIDNNDAQRGGGLFLCNTAPADIVASTIMNNDAVDGGGIRSRFGGPINITNSTVSQNTGGAVVSESATDNQSSNPVASADGRYIAFDSSASTLVPGDTTGSDVFVFDRQLGEIERVSKSPTGVQTGGSSSPSISADGRFVAFVSSTPSIVPGDTNGIEDIFVADRQTHTFERVSVSSTGVEANGRSSAPSITPDGRFVVFASGATNLDPAEAGGADDIFVFDRQTQLLDRVSVSAAGVEANEYSFSPSISADGRFVAFETRASNLVPDDTNTARDVFVFDRQMRQIERVSVTSTGEQANGQSRSPSISANGRFVVFQSSAPNLGSGSELFVFDRQTRSIDPLGVTQIYQDPFGFNQRTSPSISPDGRFVAIASHNSNLVPDDTNNRPDAFVFDRQTRAFDRVSVSTSGTEGSESSYLPAISADGRVVAFVSQSSNLVPGNTDFNTDVFVFDRQERNLFSPTIAETHPVHLESATIAENEGTPVIWGTVTSHNSLFVRNTPRSIYLSSTGFNLFSNVDRGVTLQATDLVTSFAGNSVGPLQDNGGPTWTHALLPGSLAIDTADPANSASTDQLGNSRPQDGDGLLGPRADIGAFEAYEAMIQGSVFLDRNRNRTRDPNEIGLGGGSIYLDANKNGAYDTEDAATSSVSTTGSFSFDVSPGAYWLAIQEIPNWSRTTQQAGVVLMSRNNSGIVGNNNSNTYNYSSARMSADGRFVAFESDASNLVPGDNNGHRDMFVYDQQTQSIERVSISAAGVEGNASSYAASISADGRYVAFESDASNLVSGDTNGQTDAFVFDRQNRTIERVSNAGFKIWDTLVLTSMSGDGRIVTFDTDNGIVVADRVNHTNNVIAGGRGKVSADGRYVGYGANKAAFVFDRQTGASERVDVSATGEAANGESGDPSTSADGRFVAFWSVASNLVPGDTNGCADIFVLDRQTHTLERATLSSAGLQGNSDGGFPWVSSISADGRFVAFQSHATNLVPGDTNNLLDVFVFDRQTHKIDRISVSATGVEGNFNGFLATISPDGRFVAYTSSSNNLVDEDSGDLTDVFVARNLLATGGTSVSTTLYAGQVATVDFGMVPDPGVINGRCFDDVIANGAFDNGEPGRVGCQVYLDLNANGRFDVSDVSTVSTNDGTFQFTNLDSEMEYRVGLVEISAGQTLVLPSANDNGIYKVYLPAGGMITNRDFGLQPENTTGQSQNSEIRGLLYVDQPGESNPPVAGMPLFVDLNNDGDRDFDEPRTVSANDGSYSFTGLGNRPYTVRIVDDPRLVQTTPIGNSFARHDYSLAVPGSAEGSPRDVVVGDFNDDGWPDLAMPIFDRNAVSILISEQNGGFAPPKEFSLAPAGRPTNQPQGRGPIALISGDFNGPGRDDLAVANSFSSNVAILLDFNGTTFSSETYVAAGLVPTSLATFDLLDSDGDLDLIVTNSLQNSSGTVQNVALLRNAGGTFTNVASVSAGNNPSSVAVGNFNSSDTRPDFAVADYGTNPSGSDPGDLRIFLANANGTYQASIACKVGFGPTSVVSADLNGDQKIDLAVANFLSDNVTVCLGNGDGTFKELKDPLPGGSGPLDIATADIDSDNDLDLLITNSKSQKIGILRNRLSHGTFGFDPAENFGAASIPGFTSLTLATADFDHDQKLDLAVASSLQNVVAIHQNQLIGGAHRLALTGVETVSGVDFTFQAVNLPPTLSPINPPAAVNEDSLPITVNLVGISAGSGESQPLQVSVTSNNPTLIVAATPQYQSPSATGSVQLALGGNQSGQAIVTVTVTDGGLDNDLSTTADNASVQQAFTLVVNPLNDLPTLDPLPAILLIGQNAGAQGFDLTGITAGSGEAQPLQVSAATESSDFIQNLAVQYNTADSTGIVTFNTSATDGFGQITLTVTDGGLDNNLATTGDNLSIQRSIVLLVTDSEFINQVPSFVKGGDPPNITDESATVSLPGWATQISKGAGDPFTQVVQFIVVSNSNPGLFTVPPAIDSAGKLTFTPKPNAVGMAQIAVVIKDSGGTANGGIDQSEAQTFAINVTKKRVWHNASIDQDVTGDEDVVADDVVAIINYINAGKPDKVPTDGRGGGPYYDVTGDGSIAADDVIAVINNINSQRSLQLEGEPSGSSSLVPRAVTPAASDQPFSADLLDLLAHDITNQPKRRR